MWRMIAVDSAAPPPPSAPPPMAAPPQQSGGMLSGMAGMVAQGKYPSLH